MDPTSILILSNDNSLARSLYDRLKHMGYQDVGIARDEAETVALIQSLQPDLILHDLRSTAMGAAHPNGLFTSLTQNTPILFIAGEQPPANASQPRARLASDFLWLPSEDGELRALLDGVRVGQRQSTKLESQQRWYHSLLTSLGEAVIATDLQGLIGFINPAAAALSGRSVGAAQGKYLWEILTLADITLQDPTEAETLQAITKLTIGKVSQATLLSRIRKIIPIEIRSTLIRDAAGQPQGTVLVLREITEQLEVLQAVRRQARRAEALADAASRLNNRLEVPQILYEICAIADQALKARGSTMFLPVPKLQVYRGTASFSTDERLQAHQGTSFSIPAPLLESLVNLENPVVVIPDLLSHPDWPYWEFAQRQNIHTLVIAGLFNQAQLIGALISVLRDEQQTVQLDDISLLRGLTDQASVAIQNAELFEQVRAGRERQRKLARNLVNIQEAERRHIARELHDQLGQALTGLQFMLESVKSQVGGAQQKELGEIQHGVSAVMEQVREMSLNLRPSMLDDFGLIPTLKWHFARYTGQTGIQVRFQSDEVPARIPAEIEVAAYRIVQEALTNVARYAQVKEVSVGLVVQSDGLWLEIIDRGRGFDMNADNTERPSTGLGSMRERASMVGGHVVIESYPGQGTQVVAGLPLTARPLERRRRERSNHPG